MNVLLCDDGSAGARHAITVAARLFGGGDALVLTVVASLAPEVFQGRAESVPGYAEARRTAEKGAAAAAAAGFTARPHVQVTAAQPGDGILACAEEQHADVVVVGARGISTLEAVLLGSVSHHVVQHARTPVLVVHLPREP